MKIEIDVSDLQKITDALQEAHVHHVYRDSMNAKLHLAKETRWSPLTSMLEAAYNRACIILNEAQED